MSYQIEELEKIGIDWKIKGETLNQLEVQKLVSSRKLRDKYFWFNRKGTQHLKPEGKYYSTSLGDYYDPNKVEKIKQKFKNYIHPNDQRYVSENQIIEAFNLQSARSKKRNTTYHNLLKNWILKSKIKSVGFKSSNFDGETLLVYPKKIIKVIKAYRRVFERCPSYT